MSVSLGILAGLLLLVAVAVGVILLFAALLASDRARTVLKALLIVPVVFLVIAFLAVLTLRFSSAARHNVPSLQESRAQHQARVEHLFDEAERIHGEHLDRMRHPTARLSGTITCQKRLLPHGLVRLVPTGNTEGAIGFAPVTDGRYSLAEVPIGLYRAEVTALRSKGGAEPEQYIPKRYNEESPLRVDVRRGKNGFDLTLDVELAKELAEPVKPVPSPLRMPAPAESSWEVAAADPEIAGALTRAAKAAALEMIAPEETSADETPAEETPAEEESAKETPAEGAASEGAASEESPSEEMAAEETRLEEEPAPADDRPDWVGAAPHKTNGVYQMAIDVGPFSTRPECDQAAAQELRVAIDEYVTTYLGPRARGQVRLPIEYIKGEIVKSEWEEQKKVRISPEGQIPEEFVKMPHLHLLLEFDRAVNSHIEAEWSRVVVRERLHGVGALGVLTFVLLGGVWSYLRIDLATGGAYRGRLRLVAAALVLAAIGAGCLLALIGSHASTTVSV